MKILYYAENNWMPFSTQEECEKYEAEELVRAKRWLDNSATSKFEKLKNDLACARSISPGTIVTCSYDSLAIKRMVKVCQSFAEENKAYLSHY